MTPALTSVLRRDRDEESVVTPTDEPPSPDRLRARWRAAFTAVRAATERRAAPLSAEDQVVQSMPDVSPTKWHRAHTTWFFEEFLLSSTDGYQRFHPQYAYLFNSYYEGVGPRHARAERGFLSRPGIDDIARYREYVDDAMGSALEQGRFDD